MWILSEKDGKQWWLKQDATGNWVPVTEEENATYKKHWKDKRDEIAARVLSDFFKENT